MFDKIQYYSHVHGRVCSAPLFPRCLNRQCPHACLLLCPLPLCPQLQRQDEVWKLELEDVIYSDAAETFFVAHLKCTMAPWYVN